MINMAEVIRKTVELAKESLAEHQQLEKEYNDAHGLPTGGFRPIGESIGLALELLMDCPPARMRLMDFLASLDDETAFRLGVLMYIGREGDTDPAGAYKEYLHMQPHMRGIIREKIRMLDRYLNDASALMREIGFDIDSGWPSPPVE